MRLNEQHIVNGETVYADIFASFGEMLDYCDSNPNQTGSARSDAHNAEWAGTRTVQEAFSLARNGWDAVRPEVDRLVASLRDVIMDKMENTPQVVWGVAGAIPDVGRFVSGEPECMMDFPIEPTPKAGKVVRIFVDYGASASFDGAFIMRRGTTLLALLEVLKLRGVSCEVWGETAIYTSGRGSIHTTVTKLSDPMNPLDINELMFALGHPAMLRRMAFAVREMSAQWRNIGSTYGRTTTTRFATVYGADIRMERLESRANTMVSNPVDWVMQTIEGLGF